MSGEMLSQAPRTSPGSRVQTPLASTNMAKCSTSQQFTAQKLAMDTNRFTTSKSLRYKTIFTGFSDILI
jgi:hypothetical protein